MSNASAKPATATPEEELTFDFSTYYPGWKRKAEVPQEWLEELSADEIAARVAQMQKEAGIDPNSELTTEEKIVALYEDLRARGDVITRICNDLLEFNGSSTRIALQGIGPDMDMVQYNAPSRRKQEKTEVLPRKMDGAKLLSAMEYFAVTQTIAQNLAYTHQLIGGISEVNEETQVLRDAIEDVVHSYEVLLQQMHICLQAIPDAKIERLMKQEPELKKHLRLETPLPPEITERLEKHAREVMEQAGHVDFEGLEDAKDIPIDPEAMKQLVLEGAAEARANGKDFSDEQLAELLEQLETSEQDGKIAAMLGQSQDGQANSYLGIHYPESLNYDHLEDAVVYMLTTNRSPRLKPAERDLFALGLTHSVDTDAALMAHKFGKHIDSVRSAFVEGMGISPEAWDNMLRHDLPTHYVQDGELDWHEPGYFEFEDAKNIVVQAFTNIHPDLGERAKQAFAQGWVHNQKNPNTLQAAFTAPAPHSMKEWTGAHPLVYSPFEGSVFDVIALGHEMMHALHLDRAVNLHDDDGDNLAYMETLAHLMEFQVTEAMIQQAPTAREKMDFAVNYLARETGLYEQIRAVSHISVALHNQLRERTTPFTFEELRDIVQEHWGNSLFGSLQKTTKAHAENLLIQLCGDMMGTAQTYYRPAYGFAVLGARAFTKSFMEATPEERLAMGEKLVNYGLDAAPDTGWGDVLKEIGVDVGSKSLVTDLADFPLEYLSGVSKKYQVAVPSELIISRDADGKLHYSELVNEDLGSRLFMTDLLVGGHPLAELLGGGRYAMPSGGNARGASSPSFGYGIRATVPQRAASFAERIEQKAQESGSKREVLGR